MRPTTKETEVIERQRKQEGGLRESARAFRRERQRRREKNRKIF
jgi:hypothetical protein